MNKIVNITLLVLCAALAQSCSVIDDDLSVCDKEPNLELRLDLTLHTQLQLEVNTRLNADIYNDLRPAIVNALSDIFSDKAHDINAIIFNQKDKQLARQIEDIIDRNQSSYPIYLPANDYDAIALANVMYNEVVSLYGTEQNATANFQVERKDTVQSQRTGLFRASRPIEVNDTVKTIEMHLSQVNGAVILVVDTTEYQPLDIVAYVDETASGMMIADSVFLFERKVVARTEKIEMPSTPQQAAATQDTDMPQAEHKFVCLNAVTMPSRDEADENGAFFTVRAYVKLHDGTVTQNVLSVKEPLPAGQIVIIKLSLAEQGVIIPVEDSQVGATVKLDWKPGGEHDIEF